MSRVRLFVEGETELDFVEQVLAPYLADRGIGLSPRRVGGRGGDMNFDRVVRDVVRALRQEPGIAVSTFFDYYGLGRGWKGPRAASSLATSVMADSLQHKLRGAVTEKVGGSFRTDRFLPYLQLHEFEALLFSDPRALADALGDPALESTLDVIVAACGEPERIDDSPFTAPSKRIAELVPRFDKRRHGVAAARAMGVDRIRMRCPRFSAWIARVERLGRVP